MCDYSLEHLASRPAVVGDKLVTYTFGLGTTGFTSDRETPVCLLPGSELAFDAPVAFKGAMYMYQKTFIQSEHKTAIFRQVDKDVPNRHHDCLEFPNGTTVLLTQLCDNQRATVLQLPAKVGKESDLKALESALEDVREALKEIV